MWPEFEPVQTEIFTYDMRHSVEDLVLHASTWSYVAIHPERDRILDSGAHWDAGSPLTGWLRSRFRTRCYRLRQR